MVGQFHEHLNRRQTVDLFPIQDMLCIFAVDQMLVHVLLNIRQIAANDLDEFGWQMLRIERIDAPENEIPANGRHFFLNLAHFLLLCLGRVGFPAAQNGILGVLCEFVNRSENARVGEIDHGVEFSEIILHGSSRQEDASFDRQGIECSGRLAFAILESMSFVANK